MSLFVCVLLLCYMPVVVSTNSTANADLPTSTLVGFLVVECIDLLLLPLSGLLVYRACAKAQWWHTGPSQTQIQQRDQIQKQEDDIHKPIEKMAVLKTVAQLKAEKAENEKKKDEKKSVPVTDSEPSATKHTPSDTPPV